MDMDLIKRFKVPPLLTAISLIIICVVLGSLFFSAVLYREEPPVIQEKVDYFLTNMMGYNLAEYKIVQRHYSKFSNMILEVPFLVFESEQPFTTPPFDERIETQVSCTLKTGDSDIHIMFYFAADTQMLNMYTQQPSEGFYFLTPVPSHIQQSDDVLDWTRTFLEIYYNYSGNAQYISDMQKVLDTVDNLEPQNKTSGDIELQISNFRFIGNSSFLTISMSHVNEGVDYVSKAVRFQFVNGTLTRFTDTWNLQ